MHIELTENEKNELAKDCGYSEEKYTDDVKKGVNASEYDLHREHGIKRKTIKAILDNILYGKPIPTEVIEEFMQYDAVIEGIKAEAKNAQR
jgi:hypothetical protein